MKKQLMLFFALSAVFLLALLFFKLRAAYFSSDSVPAEIPAPLQSAGTSFTYDFDDEKAGSMPAKFHGIRTGHGAPGQWVVMPDSSAPSRPNVVAQNLADPTDSRFALLVSDGGSFADF